MSIFFRYALLWLALSAGLAHAAALTVEQQALHVLNRLGYGPRPGDVERVTALGVDAYIAQQLHPETIPLPETLAQQLASLTTINQPADRLLATERTDRLAAKQDDAVRQTLQTFNRTLVTEVAADRLYRALASPRQLEEVMVDFWFNHFNVFTGKGLDHVLLAAYQREAIRPYVLGHFRDLLGATAHHPAMLFYLDNWLSVAANASSDANPNRRTGLNENYARELMELHTLGVDGGYTQQDVTELARMFTGWTFDPKAAGDNLFRFAARHHDTGSKIWLGHSVPANGVTEGEWALDVLAAAPATAHHISHELAQYFVSDHPPVALVDRLAQRFTDTHGDIRAVLTTLFASPEFWGPNNVGQQFKTPYQYVVSALRAGDVSVRNVRPVLNALHQMGMPLYGCQTPDGYKTTEAAWLDAGALTLRINFATALAAGRLPLSKPLLQEAQDLPIKAMATGDAAQPIDGPTPKPNPISPDVLMQTLAFSVSPQSLVTIAKNPIRLRAALLLGSPEFMRH